MSEAAAPARPLAGIRVLEVGDTIGRRLRRAGCWPTWAPTWSRSRTGHGDPIRALGPFAVVGPTPSTARAYAYLHAAKRSVRADVRAPEGQDLLRRLVAGTDVVLQATGSGPAVAGRRHPRRRPSAPTPG